MKLNINKGSTSQILHIFISDSLSTSGAGLAGVEFGDILISNFMRPGDTGVTGITLADITTLGTYESGGFKEIDDTERLGWYEFHPPNTAFLSGVNSVSFHLAGATDMAPLPIEVQLVNNVFPLIFKKNTDSPTAISFDLFDSTGALKPGLDTGDITAKISIDAGAFQNMVDFGNIAEVSGALGSYLITPKAADLNGNFVKIHFSATLPSGIQTTIVDIQTVE